AYFYLKHRREPRGIGGVFFDDLAEGGVERCFGLPAPAGDPFLPAVYPTPPPVGAPFLPAYTPILARRPPLRYGERERDFQAYRRGRYVEFNLVWDRGTLFGLQSGGRAESILMSLPPIVRWRYDWKPERGTPEAKLATVLMPPRDWAA